MAAVDDWPEAAPQVAFRDVLSGLASDITNDARIGLAASMVLQKGLDQLSDGRVINLNFDGARGDIRLDGQDYNAPRATRITLVHAKGKSINIKNFEIEILEMGVNDDTFMTIEKCRIRLIRVVGTVRRIVIDDCLIQTLAIMHKSNVGPTHISNSFIGSLSVSTTEAFGGDVRLLKSDFDRRPESGIPGPTEANISAGTPQDYRYARLNLLALGNQRAASNILAVELSLERKAHPLDAAWLINLCYEMTADFGNSIARPAGWFWASVAFGILVVLISNGATVADAPSHLLGWHAQLIKHGWYSRSLRAAVLELRYLRNPFAFLETHPLIVACHFWLPILLTVQSLFSLITLALCVIAVRRQFKLG